MMTGTKDGDFVNGFQGVCRPSLLGHSAFDSYGYLLPIQLQGFDENFGKGEIKECPLLVVDKYVKRSHEPDRIFLNGPL